jgi:hypothetical protein
MSDRHGRLWAAAAVCAVLMPGAAAAVEPPRHPVARVVYDYALTEYCGLVSPAVLSGFRAEYRDLVEAHDLDEAQARDARIEAWMKIEQEWGNRGLGGFRDWCRVDGAEAVARFESYAERP